MKKPAALKKGDKIAIVSLSSGVIGEPFVQHEVKLLEERLKELGLDFVYMDNAKKGMEYLKNHPEARAADLVQAFKDKSVKAVWTVIGGDDTFRTLPYLLMNDEFKQLVAENPKIFIGFSDTTTNHLMFHKLGLKTYYGPSLLADIAELGPEILPYTKEWINELFEPTTEKEVTISPVWYSERESFGEDQLGVPRTENEEKHGFEFFGEGIVEGELLGGCIESLYEMLEYSRYDEQKEVFEKYPIFPEREEWKGKILFVETSEERPTPEKYETMLSALEKRGVFDEVVAIIAGKPQDEAYYNEYKAILARFAEQHNLPFVYNLNFGHATPRLILPYGQKMRIDFDDRKINLAEGIVGA